MKPVLHRALLFQGLLALSVWLAWYTAGGTQAIAELVVHWKVAVTMVFGSLIAGATSEGGGAVAFPVFTKVLHVDPIEAKVFSLAIQSVGMTAASALIVYLRVPVEWRVVGWASLGGICGIVAGTAWLAPALPPTIVKMTFTMMVTSFAVTLYALNRGIVLRHTSLPAYGTREIALLVLAGLVGGTMSGLVGNGIDIITFALVVLLFRLSEKIATPTSVVLMAINAVVGFALHALVLGGFTPQVQAWWIAAIPVVVVGAPTGALICARLSRRVIARFLIALIAIELISSLVIIPLTPAVLAVSLAMLGLFAGLSVWMYRTRAYVIGAGAGAGLHTGIASTSPP